MTVTVLGPTHAPDVVRLLAAAFAHYPVMRHVLGHGADYATRLEILIGLFVTARVLRQDLVLGILDLQGRLQAAALLTLPGERPPPHELSEYREEVWRRLGADARARYDAFSAAAAPFAPPEPHHHLNMIGVAPAYAGQGLGRRLLDHIHALVDRDSSSTGVSLTTETESNRGLYRHFGYRQIGHARIAPGLETWGFFRASGGAGVP